MFGDHYEVSKMTRKIVEVEWLDHAGDSNTDKPIHEIIGWELMQYTTVGYLLEEYDDRIIVGFSISENEAVSGVMVIAKKMIEKLRVIEDPNS